MQWPALGNGQRMSVSRQLLIEEEEGSSGFMIISPDQYQGDLALTFETVILTSDTVVVAGLIGNDADGRPLAYASEYDGSLGYVINSAPLLMAAFHNRTHNRPGPFLADFEGGRRNIRDEADQIFTRVDTTHKIEFRKTKETVSLSIDGEKVVSATANSGVANANIMLRIRGTGFRQAAAIFRNVSIVQCGETN